MVTSFANTASRGGRVVPLVVSSTVPTAERKSPPSIQTSPSTTSSSHSSGTCQTSNRQIGGRPLKSAKVSQHHKQNYICTYIKTLLLENHLNCLVFMFDLQKIWKSLDETQFLPRPTALRNCLSCRLSSNPKTVMIALIPEIAGKEGFLYTTAMQT